MAKKLKFKINTHYKGRLVGPDGDTDTIEVSEFWAKFFLENNAAQEVAESKPPAESSQKQNAPPK